jgi:hypothetical protein
MTSTTMSHTFVDSFKIEATRSFILVEHVVGAFSFVSHFVDIFCTLNAEKLAVDYMTT